MWVPGGLRTYASITVVALLITVLWASLYWAYPYEPQATSRVVVFESASLSVLVGRVRDRLGPLGVVVLDEAKGSLQLVRELVSLRKEADVFITVDSRLVRDFLFPSGRASWAIEFATSSMVMAYSPRSKLGNEVLRLVSEGEWAKVFDLITSPGARIGLGDPDLAPQGYRSLMLLKLAGALFKGDPEYYLRVAEENNVFVYARSAPALVPLLETAEVDVVFTYFHEAVNHGLSFVELPDELSLSNPEYEALYSRVYVELPGGVVEGETIRIAFTILNPPVNPRGAILFSLYLLSEPGRSLMREVGLAPIEPPRVLGEAGMLPDPIKIE